MAQNEGPERTVPEDGLAPEKPRESAPPNDAARNVPTPPDEPTLVLQVVERLINGLGLRPRLELERRPDGYYVNILTRRATAILIGHRGSTLKSIQYLARLIVKRSHPSVPPIIVDVGGYAERRDNMLRHKATAVARIVLETGREMALDMLTEKEMHFVRDELASLPGVRVYAVGDGPRRTVIIAPRPPGQPDR